MLKELHWVVLCGWAGLGCQGEIVQGLTDGDESDQMTSTALPPGTDIADTAEGNDTPEVAYATVGQKARVTAQSGLHLRTGPSTNYAIILTMPYGAIVNVIASSSGWYRVTYGSHTGWSSGAYLATVTSTSSGTTAVDHAIDRARSGVGFSYHWGGGCWDPSSSHHGACYGNCPNCSHSGTWGADCSGYVAKIWQVPGPSALTACTHPYSTYNFRYTTAHWRPVARSNAHRGDALVHHESGSGHIFLFESGDGWGWMRAYEAKGCSYGIQHDTRMAASNYIAIRRTGY